jgi:2-polyprenyl-3-methyl-5-hydroxy-6-metoxy-1,4-benzoquinol methylase
MDYININKQAWDKRAKTHLGSTFYDVAAFLNGKSSLNSIELDQVGDVEAKKLLHLQCHFGQDTLSWARQGAQVTGVDLSTQAIEEAEILKDKLGIKATFIAKDIYQFGRENNEHFDIVFTSYGVLCWLHDLKDWAKTIANALVDGGEFHLVEFHSFNDLLEGHSYFPQSEPDVEEEGTYTENCDGTKSTTLTWAHSLSEVINALIQAGLSIECFKEYAYSPYNCIEGMEYVSGQGYQVLHKGQQVPLLYSVKAIKPADNARK